MCRTHSVARLFLTMTLASIGGACGTSDPQKPPAAPAATSRTIRVTRTGPPATTRWSRVAQAAARHAPLP